MLIAVYPRWRGEHAYIAVKVVLTNGLSPLARGTLNTVNQRPLIVRFIPAGAGNTSI
ncbi:hypothetical protein [Salmonella enterica subsp. enterica serovar Kentucky]|nr:hypothetical protein [Salmonella enterica subsp. enterica serovar Kentucky]